ncbi:hypothetical protein [Clostridium sp.]|uniref:hypothetical protein n=1 Tax=Clostridium sp. TaxID=1506 RepID=UPI00346386F8
MSNIDELMAKLKLERKIENKNKEKENIEEPKEEEDKEAILKRVTEEMNQGDVTLEGRKFKFVRKRFLDERIELLIPLGYFEERVNENNNLILVNEGFGLSINFTYINQGAIKQSFDDFKAGMEKQFKNMEFYLEWIESREHGEGDSKISYGTYKTPTGKGDIYNAIIYREKNGTSIIGNYNCFYKDLKIWEFLIKGTIMSMRILK